MIISSVARKVPVYLTLVAPKEGDIFRINETPGAMQNPGSNAKVFNFDYAITNKLIKGIDLMKHKKNNLINL